MDIAEKDQQTSRAKFAATSCLPGGLGDGKTHSSTEAAIQSKETQRGGTA